MAWLMMALDPSNQPRCRERAKSLGGRHLPWTAPSHTSDGAWVRLDGAVSLNIVGGAILHVFYYFNSVCFWTQTTEMPARGTRPSQVARRLKLP
jgi:hypothetical protein